MEKIKENVIEINQTGGIESQATYYANYIVLNEIRIRGNLEDDDETTLCIEIYDNDNNPDNIIQSNYMSFSCEYNDLESYQFDGHLTEEITATLALSDKYRL